jgi:hypothetical protein
MRASGTKSKTCLLPIRRFGVLSLNFIQSKNIPVQIYCMTTFAMPFFFTFWGGGSEFIGGFFSRRRNCSCCCHTFLQRALAAICCCNQIQLSMWSLDILKPGGSGQHLSPQSFKPETETEKKNFLVEPEKEVLLTCCWTFARNDPD